MLLFAVFLATEYYLLQNPARASPCPLYASVSVIREITDASYHWVLKAMAGGRALSIKDPQF